MTSLPADKRGLLALAGSSASIFWVGALCFGFPGVMGPYWKAMFHVGGGAIGNTVFFQLASLGIFMFLVGKWQERYGVRKMLITGTVLLSLNMLTLAFASNVTMLYLWAFFNGTASCFIYAPGLTCVQRWFPTRRGLASGIVNFTFGISAAIMSPLFHRMLESMGYQRMNLAVAAMALVTGLVAAFFTRSPEQPAAGPAAAPGAPPSPQSFTVRESFRTRSFWFLWLTWCFQGAAGIAMVTLSTTFGLSRGYSMESAVMILTAFNIMNGGGRIIMGYLSDVINRNFAMSVTFLAAGAAYLLLPHVTEMLATQLLAAVIGLAFGSLFAVSAPLAADCFGMEHFGAIFGAVFTAYGFFSGILGPSLSGYLLDATGGNFTVVFTYLAVFCLLSGALIRFVFPGKTESPEAAESVTAVQEGDAA